MKMTTTLKEDHRPNVLMIMLDQFRAKSMTGCGDGISTPNIDRIRSGAVDFSKAVCTAPLCTPSRISLATGKLPHRCGALVHDVNLSLDETTYYQLMRKAGYRVAVAGKTDLYKMEYSLGEHGPLPVSYHIGFTDSMETEGRLTSVIFPRDTRGNPVAQGPYQRYLCEKDPDILLRMQEQYIFNRDNHPIYFAEPCSIDAEDRVDAFIGRTACDFLEKLDEDSPWHFFVSFNGPHSPWDPDAAEVDKLRGKQYAQTPQDDLAGKPQWIKRRAALHSRGLTPELLYNTKLHYDGSIQEVDRWIGKLLDILEQRGLADRTAVILTADHGEMLGDHGLFVKSVMYEGAIRIPLLVRLPGMERPRTSRAHASLMDLAPTILDICGVAYDPSSMDALSLLPVIQGARDDIREVQLSELHNTMMLCDGRYKWIRNYNDTDELYDLDSDPDELYNIIDGGRDIIARLSRYTFEK